MLDAMTDVEQIKTVVKMAGANNAEFRQAFNALYDKWRIRATALEISPEDFLDFFVSWLFLRKNNYRIHS